MKPTPTPNQKAHKAEYFARLRADYDSLADEWDTYSKKLKQEFFDSFMQKYSGAMHQAVREGYSVRFIRYATGHTDARTVQKIMGLHKPPPPAMLNSTLKTPPPTKEAH